MSYYPPPPAARKEMVAAGRLVAEPATFNHGLGYVMANWQKAPWNDKRFSLALRCAIDSRKIIETVENGVGSEGPVFPLADVSGGSDWGLTKEEWKAIHPCHGPTAETNMDERRQIARTLLADMGFTAENPARPYAVVRSNGTDVWASILSDLQSVGIDPKYEIFNSAQRYAKYQNGEFDIMEIGIRSGLQDPDHWLYELFYSTSDRNYGRYTNAELDALIDEQSRTLDRAKRQEHIKEISRIILQDNVTIRYDFRMSIPYYPPWVNNFHIVFPDTQSTWQQMKAVWIDPAKLEQLGAK